MKSLLLDTNVLLLYLIGNADVSRVGGKRLQDFDLQDLQRLNRFVTKRTRFVTLPNILSEASNLIGSGKQELMAGGSLLLAHFCSKVDEVYVESAVAAVLPVYQRLGLTDAAIWKMADSGVKVLTCDNELHGLLRSKGIDVVNLRHFRTPKFTGN